MPPEGKYFLLTPEYKALLDDLLAERRAKTARPHRETPDELLPQPNKMYVARTLEEIPALTEVAGDESEDEPGFGTCDIYQIIRDDPDVTPRLVKVLDQDRTVYNINLDPIGANRWVPITADEYGNWIAQAIFPWPSEEDPTGGSGYTGTGTSSDIPPGDEPPGDDPVYSDTGTGTNPETGGPGGIFYPCTSVSIEETDLFCEPGLATILHARGGLGTGTGTGTDEAPNQYYLNLYKRTVLLGINRWTGCLEKIPLDWEYVRTVGCCEPECTEPDTGTSPPDYLQDCCSRGSLYERLSYSLYGQIGPVCATCSVAGNLWQENPDRGMVYTNRSGGSTCGGRVFLELRLYCVGTSWRASGTMRTYLPGVEDITRTFDVALSVAGALADRLEATFTMTGCAGSLLLRITNPCYHLECIDDTCTEKFGEALGIGQYPTVEECELFCPEEEEPIETDCCVEPIPATLTATITNKTGDCSTLGDTAEVTYESVSERWSGIFDGATGCEFRLRCNAGTWELLTVASCVVSVTPVSTSCDPLSLVFDVNNAGGVVCTGTFRVTFTE